jgi:hypothetical protein
MDPVQVAFLCGLFLCVLYSSAVGGRTGKAGSVIFLLAAILSAAAAVLNPDWDSTSYAVLAVDAMCLVALAMLALTSSRFWPIWATGFQLVAVATHLATIWIPYIVPEAYQAMQSFWSIPILSVMVAGTRKDRKYKKGSSPRG